MLSERSLSGNKVRKKKLLRKYNMKENWVTTARRWRKEEVLLRKEQVSGKIINTLNITVQKLRENPLIFVSSHPVFARTTKSKYNEENLKTQEMSENRYIHPPKESRTVWDLVNMYRSCRFVVKDVRTVQVQKQHRQNTCMLLFPVQVITACAEIKLVRCTVIVVFVAVSLLPAASPSSSSPFLPHFWFCLFYFLLFTRLNSLFPALPVPHFFSAFFYYCLSI